MELMRNQNYGCIANISSINAQAGQVGQTNYCAAKATVISFTKALACESTFKNITVNCIAPGTAEMVGVVPEVLLLERALIESVFSKTKLLGKFECSRHRSVTNDLVHMVAALIMNLLSNLS